MSNDYEPIYSEDLVWRGLEVAEQYIPLDDLKLALERRGNYILAMADVFYSPRLTLTRADHHIREFNEVLNRFIAERPWTRFIDKDPEFRRDLHKAKLTKEPPEILSCILFDATNNLRAVLDQIGYASAIAANRKSMLKAIKFPFGPTEEK